jgi:hypothetical protein
MDFLKLLKDSVPNAGPKSTQQVLDAQQKLEMLRVKNPQEAEVFSKQLAGTITSKGDPRSIFEGIAKSYGASLGKQPTQAEEPIQNLTSGIDASIGLIRSSGGNVSEGTMKAIEEAKAAGNPAALKTLGETLGKTAQEVINRTAMPPTAKESADAAIAKKAKEDEKIAAVEDLKNQYNNIVAIKNHPQIRQAFGMPIGVTSTGYPGGIVSSRLIPGTGASEASAGVNQLANQAWVNKIISAKNAGLTLGSVDKIEGAKLALAATKLAEPQKLTYETGNRELQAMAESVKKLYTKATGRNIAEDIKTETPPPAKVDPTQSAAAYMMGIPSTLPPQ